MECLQRDTDAVECFHAVQRSRIEIGKPLGEIAASSRV
jgi:hypothetical protein